MKLFAGNKRWIASVPIALLLVFVLDRGYDTSAHSTYVVPSGPVAVATWSGRIDVDPSAGQSHVNDLAMNQNEAHILYGRVVPSGNSNIQPLYSVSSANNGINFDTPALRGCTQGTSSANIYPSARVVEDSQKYIFVVWLDFCINGSSNGPNLFFTSRTPGGTWRSGPVQMTSSVTKGASVAVANNGTIHISYSLYDGNASRLWYTKSTDRGATFSTPVALTSILPLGGSYITSVVADASNNPHVLYQWETNRGGNEYTSSMCALDYLSGGWTSPNCFYAKRSYWPDAASGANGVVGVTWQSRLHGIMYAHWDASNGWYGIVNVSRNISNPGGQEQLKQFPTLTYDHQGLAHFAWIESQGATLYLMYAAEEARGQFSAEYPVQGNFSYVPQLASYNNNLGLAYKQGDDYQGRKTYFRRIQLPTLTPTRTPTPGPTPTPCGQMFNDVPCNYWAFGYIRALNTPTLIMAGYTARETCINPPASVEPPCFIPRKNVTRAELTKVLYRARGWTPSTPSTPSFTDVGPSNWAYVYVETAFNRGVINGKSPAECAIQGQQSPCFLPNNPINRAEMAKTIYRAAQYNALIPASQTFSDIGLNHWAYVYIETLNSKSVMRGYNISSVCGSLALPCYLPNNNVPRDESAKAARLMILSP